MAIKNVTHRGSPERLEVVVDVAAQTLRVMDGATVAAEFPVSTSRFGLGFEEGSYRTPTGRFVIRDKIGHGAPAWTIFRARRTPENRLGRQARIRVEPDFDLGRSRSAEQQHHGTVCLHPRNQPGGPDRLPCQPWLRAVAQPDIITLHDMVSPGTPSPFYRPGDILESFSLSASLTVSHSSLAYCTEGGDSRMTIVKVIAIVAVAAASLSLGACASKSKPAPAPVSYSK